MDHWLGVDVGGKGKGFDAAVVSEEEVVAVKGRLAADDVLDLVHRWVPVLAAVDSPRCWAPDGETARPGELTLNRAVCGIRWTPDQRAGASNPYYEWVREGLVLYEALERLGVPAIEVFPTASWTRWGGARGGVGRGPWSRRVLASLSLSGVPPRTNQDQRDAIAAALTARQHTAGATETFGEIVVPLGST